MNVLYKLQKSYERNINLILHFCESTGFLHEQSDLFYESHSFFYGQTF